MSTVNINLVRTGENCEAVVVIGSRTLVLDASQIMLADGVVRMAVPLDIEVPAECVEVHRPVAPDAEQLRRAVEALPTEVLARVLLREQQLSADESWAEIVKRSVSLALGGDQGGELR